MTLCASLPGYTARLLDGEARAEFERHLDSCEVCRLAVERSAALDQELAAWLERQPAVEVREVAARRLVRAAAARGLRGSWRRPTWALVAVAVMGLLVVLGGRWRRQGAPLAGPPTPPPSSSSAEMAVTLLFAEGGQLSPVVSEARALEVPGEGRIVVRAASDVLGLGARSRAELLPTQGGRARVRLTRGLVAVEAAHRDNGGTLSVEAGGYTVNVVGTRFSVAWDGVAALAVVVGEGQVMVVQPDGHVRMVRAGQSLHFGDEAGAGGTLGAPSAVETATLARTLRTTVGSVDVAPSASVVASTSSVARPLADVGPNDATIRKWLLDGDTARAERALIARLALAPKDSASWWLLGETRRRASQPAGAVTAYRKVIEFGGPSEANRARYQAALLLEQRLGDSAGAISLYRAYIAASPAPLAAAARLRLGRLLESVGDATARSVLEDLVRLHPGTPEAEQAASLLAKP